MSRVFAKSWWTEQLAKRMGVLLVSVAVIMCGLGYWVGTWGSRSTTGTNTAEATQNAKPSGDDEPTLWTCSMHPSVRQPKPGKCPLCAMDLIPVAKATGGLRSLTLSPEAVSLMQIETARVEQKFVTNPIRMVGKVAYDETRLGYITAWVSGRLDRLYVDFTGVQVRKDDHMVYIYSEELYAAQEELIQSLKYARERPATSTRLGATNLDLVQSAREKLRLLGLSEDQIKKVEARSAPMANVTIYSPVSGVVIEKLKQEGERVKLGDRIYTVADLTQVWVHLDAYESDLPWVRYGQDVTVTTEAYPGEEFHGRIAFIQPVLNDKTRTVKVRVNVPNEQGKLKPDMFVRAVVTPRVAGGGKVMDPSLAGKWISPMHPEVIKDEPGTCDICGMPLVRAETLGYVTPDAGQFAAPLVVPRQAVLVTGTRAVVYVRLPDMPSFAEPAFLTLSTIVNDGKTAAVREAFSTYAKMLDRPYDQPGTPFARETWNHFADQLSQLALAGSRTKSPSAAKQTVSQIETVMDEARAQFAPVGDPTFEGREIVLGTRAGDYYLVRNGLQDGELVVIAGNFKIDSEIQLSAKPSMMTPAGGGSSSAHHHGQMADGKKGDGQEEHAMVYSADFYSQIRDLEAAYEELSKAMGDPDAANVSEAFTRFGQALGQVDRKQLTGDARLQWNEYAMLLSNDAVEGHDVLEPDELDRVFLLTKGHMRRMREALGVENQPEPVIERLVVNPDFKAELARIWIQYLAIQQSLASDDGAQALKTTQSLKAALASVDAGKVSGHAAEVWRREQTNLKKLVTGMLAAKDMKAARVAFYPLSQEIGVLAKSFGFGPGQTVFELHCPMAFQGQGATWYQDNDQTRNPYYGSSMLKCADRVEPVLDDKPAEAEASDAPASTESSNH